MYRERLYLPDHLPNEKVEFVLRRHLFVAFGEGLLFIVLFAIPVGFYYFFKILFPHLLASEVVYTLLLLSVSVYYLYILLFAYTSFIDYWLDIWVVTNERIISIEQRGLFARKFSEQQLFLLQDVSSEVHGILATLFHFGDIVAQSAGSKQNAIFKQVPRADQIAVRIMQLAEASRKNHPGEG